MSKNRSIAILAAMVLFAGLAGAQTQLPAQTPSTLFPAPPTRSPAFSTASFAAARFWEIGYGLAHAPNITGPQADQGIILLTAAKSLNSQITGVEPLLLALAARHSEKNYSEPVIFWLQKYVDESADRVIVADAIRYLMDRAGTPQERQTILERVAFLLKNKNSAINSELATSLAMLLLEQGDVEKAKSYLVQAYNNNKFNRAAFAKLAELAPKEMGPAIRLEHLRLLVQENPLDLKAALAFAGYSERLQLYEVAARSYQYCAELYRYLYPTEPLPLNVYLPWAITCYNTTQGLPVCLDIAENIRKLGKFDILLEAIAGRAALKMGQPQEARRIFQRAEQRAQELLLQAQEQPQTPAPDGNEPVRPVNTKQLAWFYCFADPDPAKAVEWANKAYSAEPNSPAAGALLAYAFSINKQLEWAKPLLAAAEQNQIVDLVQAAIQLAAGNKPDAIATIQTAITKDAGSLAAERARELLHELGSEYGPPVETRALVAFLAERFGRTFIPQFTTPDKAIEVQFSARGSDFTYGHEIDGVIAILNRAPEPLIVTDNSLFQGNIRITAHVEGDLQRDIPNLVSETIRTSLVVPPGKSVVHTVRLSTGELRELLSTFPQATLKIQFTLYLDPVVTDQGAISNRLVDLQPVAITVTRPRVAVSGDLVQGRASSLASAPEAQKVETAGLFTGLLKEQQVMAEHGALYAFQYADWMSELLHNSLVRPTGLLIGGPDNEWGAKVSTMADMLTLPLDQELANAVAKNLTQGQWPVRLMAVYLLARSPTPTGSFGSVLDWAAQSDTDELVRSMAASLQAASPLLGAPRLPALQFDSAMPR